jgi:ABC-type enterochelin transport system ATPase subunit
VIFNFPSTSEYIGGLVSDLLLVTLLSTLAGEVCGHGQDYHHLKLMAQKLSLLSFSQSTNMKIHFQSILCFGYYCSYG